MTHEQLFQQRVLSLKSQDHLTGLITMQLRREICTRVSDRNRTSKCRINFPHTPRPSRLVVIIIVRIPGSELPFIAPVRKRFYTGPDLECYRTIPRQSKRLNYRKRRPLPRRKLVRDILCNIGSLFTSLDEQ